MAKLISGYLLQLGLAPRIGLDAHWAVKTTVKGVEGTNPLFQVGDELAFVVHSPTAIFGSADEAEAKGEIIRMDLFGTTEKDGRIGFHTLQHHFEDSANKTTPTTELRTD